MNDDWEKRRNRAIMTAMQTGRPVFADSDGVMRFVDGDKEPVGDDVGWTGQGVPVAKVKVSWWTRLKQMFSKRKASATMRNLTCRHCGLPWPGDENISLDDLRRGAKLDLPICIKAPPADKWFKDSGINGHMFDQVEMAKETPT